MIECQPFVLFHLQDETGTAAGFRVFLSRTISITNAQTAAEKMAAHLGVLSGLDVRGFDICWRFVAERDTLGIAGSDNYRRGLLFVGADETNGDIIEMPVLDIFILQNECIQIIDTNNVKVNAFIAELTDGFYTLDDATPILEIESIAIGRNYGPTVAEWMVGIS